ncbi:MAG: UBP-type zinc finger domain-containing protein [Actinobacteria bacterium]|nr:UBP-type zinc finger domain-containing protein [Actinomycetota bacterium]
MAGSAGTWDVAGLSDFQVAHCDLTILDSYHHPHTPEAPQVDNDDIDPTVPPSGTGCVECDRTGGWWVHLRRCAACGHIGCCDTSPSQHASHHAQDTGHPVIQSFEPGEDWFYDYRSGDFVDGPTLAPPTSHPADQAVPGPADRVPPDWRSLIH